MLRLREINSIKDIEQEAWDSILEDGDYFHSHSFVKTVEESKVENAVFRYLLIYDGNSLVATTALSAFNISLDLFISNNFLVRKIKQFRPNFFVIKLVACGLPASFGQSNLRVIQGCDVKEVCRLINLGMRKLASESGARFMTVKELNPAELKSFSFFEGEGFFSGHSIPYMNLVIRWRSFAEYVNSLRHSYRRRILLSLKKMDGERPRIKSRIEIDPAVKKASLVLSEPQSVNAEEFYKMYLGVMRRTPTKLETLNKAFFENLLRENGKLKVLSVIAGNKNISSAVLVQQGDMLTFMLAGREEEKDDYDSYFNLVYGIIAYSIESGCNYLKMGQTAYWVKQSVGALPENEYLYFASTSKSWHWLISRFRNVFFPPTVLKTIHVFREGKKQNVLHSAQGEVKNFIVTG